MLGFWSAHIFEIISLTLSQSYDNPILIEAEGVGQRVALNINRDI